MSNSLVRFWDSFKIGEAPYIHPKDKNYKFKKGRSKGQTILETDCVHKNAMDFKAFLKSKSFGNDKDTGFHLSILPSPYKGDLKRAKIFILLLNPGLSYTDYYGERRGDGNLTRKLKANLKQKLGKSKFPFIWLDPGLCWHAGFVWWESKLRNVLRKIAKNDSKSSYNEALQRLSQKIACIEIVPYHSLKFKNSSFLHELPSVKAAKNFVLKNLLPRAERGEITLIVTRQSKAWGLKKLKEKIIVYEGGQTRGASLGSCTEGGKAILQKFGIEPKC